MKGFLFGAGLAAAQTLAAAGQSCELPRSGHCSACGSCLIVLLGLSSWALWRGSARHED